MSEFDTINLRHDAAFLTKLFTNVWWVPFSTLGKSQIPKQLFLTLSNPPKKISTVYEYIQYLQYLDFQERNDCFYMEDQGLKWECHPDPESVIQKREGCCASLSDLAVYILKKTYPSIGTLCTISNSGVGHAVNYIISKENEYYFFDSFTQIPKHAVKSAVETGEKRDFLLSKYTTGICIKAASILDFIAFFERFQRLKKKEFVYFAYSTPHCPRISINLEGDDKVHLFTRRIDKIQFFSLYEHPKIQIESID